MKKLLMILLVATIATITLPAAQALSGHCDYSGNGCYGCTQGNHYHGGSHGYSQRTSYWSSWEPMRVKYHYPYSNRWGEHPGPYAHSYY